MTDIIQTLLLSVIGLALVLAFSLAPKPEPSELTTQWKGTLVYAEKDPTGAYAGYTLSIESKYEVGLRSDGVMIWREKKP